MPSHFPSGLNFRAARDADGSGLAALIAGIFADYENCPFVPEEFPELIRPATHYTGKGGQIWVLERASKPKSTAIYGSIAVVPSWRPGVGELFKVYLAHDLRGTGVAKSMLDHALAVARALEMTQVVLWTDTRFVSGHRFYEKNGFIRLPGVRALHDAAKTLEFGYHRMLGSDNPA